MPQCGIIRFIAVKTKYGDDAVDLDSEASSSSEDDEVGVELTEEIEKKFFKTLSCLKNKDPRIYDQNVKFFDESDTVSAHKKKEKKEKPVYIKDYERQLLLEKGGIISDSEDEKLDAPRFVTNLATRTKRLRVLVLALLLVLKKRSRLNGILKKHWKM